MCLMLKTESIISCCLTVAYYNCVNPSGSFRHPHFHCYISINYKESVDISLYLQSSPTIHYTCNYLYLHTFEYAHVYAVINSIAYVDWD